MYIKNIICISTGVLFKWFIFVKRFFEVDSFAKSALYAP